MGPPGFPRSKPFFALRSRLRAKGNGPAQRSVQRSLQKIEAERFALRMELLKTAMEYQANARRIAEDRRRRGLPDDDPNMPRSHDVIIDMETQAVAVVYPDFLGCGLLANED